MNPQRAHVIATAIRMKRSQHAGPFLVVEGRDDRLLLEQLTRQGACRYVVAESKGKVCEVMGILDQEQFGGVLGVIDADFDRVLGQEIGSPNIVRPQYHDLETMLMCSPALNRVLSELGSEEKVEGFGQDVAEGLLQRAMPAACLRLYSQRAGLALKFDGLHYSAWVDPKSFEASEDKLAKEVRNRSQRWDSSEEALLAGIKEVATEGLDPREMCCGADLIEILSVGLRSVLGTNDASKVNGEVLRRSLRLAYSERHFAESSLFAEIRQWETKNVSFQVLRR